MLHRLDFNLSGAWKACIASPLRRIAFGAPDRLDSPASIKNTSGQA